MGWALVPTTWFTNEYKRHLNDTYTYTYTLIDNFNLERHITDSNKLLYKLKSRFNDHITPDKRKLLNPTDINDIQIPYMKLLPKVHKLTTTASPRNLDLLTGRPIITAHSWTTSNVSKLLGTELDNIIKQLKDLFHSRNIHFPLIYNSSELIDLLQQQHVTDINHSKLLTFDFTSLYTKISFQDTINAIVSSCKLLNFSNFYRDFLLNLNDFINNRNFFSTGQNIYQQTQGVAMGSYHSRQIADLVLLISEFYYFTNNRTTKHPIFSRYIDDGFLFTTTNINPLDIITNLISYYPKQIPITFTSNQHCVHYLDLTISLNYHTLLYNKIHYQVYQKPNHKYMYPHFSSNHPSHIFPGIIKTETIRYSRLSSTPDDYNFVRKLFSLRLKSLNYPSRLITTNTFPFLSYHGHKRRTKRLKQNNKQQDFTVFYKTRYNKNTRTDKIVHHILRKYHNKRIPILTKTYCNSTKLHTLLLTNKKLHNKLIFNSYT